MYLTDDTQDAKSGRSSHLSEQGAGSEKRELRYASVQKVARITSAAKVACRRKG